MTRFRHFLLAILPVYGILLASCGTNDDNEDYGPDALQLKISTDALAENTIHPSLVLGLGKIRLRKNCHVI